MCGIGGKGVLGTPNKNQGHKFFGVQGAWFPRIIFNLRDVSLFSGGGGGGGERATILGGRVIIFFPLVWGRVTIFSRFFRGGS